MLLFHLTLTNPIWFQLEFKVASHDSVKRTNLMDFQLRNSSCLWIGHSLLVYMHTIFSSALNLYYSLWNSHYSYYEHLLWKTEGTFKFPLGCSTLLGLRVPFAPAAHPETVCGIVATIEQQSIGSYFPRTDARSCCCRSCCRGEEM